MFGVTPDKQTLAPRDELIDMLHNKGLFKAIADLYKAVDKERHVSKAERASEQLKELGASTITEEVMDKFDSMARPSPSLTTTWLQGAKKQKRTSNAQLRNEPQKRTFRRVNSRSCHRRN